MVRVVISDDLDAVPEHDHAVHVICRCCISWLRTAFVGVGGLLDVRADGRFDVRADGRRQRLLSFSR